MTTTFRPGTAEPLAAWARAPVLGAVPPGGTDEAAAMPLPDPAPDLAAQGRVLVQVFPLEDRGTGLVLYAGPPGELRIHWRLERDDFERAAASFPSLGGRPATVLRLRRDRPQGGADLADELPLGPGVRDGSGEGVVHIPTDHCHYRAELGLTNADGGWLMLARSNGLYNAVGIGLDLVALLGGEDGPDQGSAGDAAPEAIAPASPDPGSGVTPAEPPVEPALGPGAALPALGDFPVIPWERSPVAARAYPAGITERRVSTVGGPGGAGVERAQALPVEGQGGVAPRESASATAGPRPVGAGTPGLGLQLPGWEPGPSGLAPTRIGVSLAPLTYESPPERAGGLELEAELRIVGRAPPGSTVDLFGFPYRVGPGGRFQLVLPVTDPELLRRALADQPPAELTQDRDD
jgi:hypothetical protein